VAKSSAKAKPVAKPKKETRGGARAGAGRPREKLPKDLLDGLGAPPTDPLKKSEWWGRLLEVLQFGVLKGEAWTTMLRDAQRSAVVASKLVPEEIKARAAALLDQEERDAQHDVSPPVKRREEDRLARSNAGALRRDPS
jgi:hypothetical protein